MFSWNNRLNVARPIVVLASYSRVAVSILEATYLPRSRCGKIARVVCTLWVHSSYLLISRPAFREVQARSAYALLSFKSKIWLVLSVSPIILTSTGPISTKFAGFRREYVSIPGGTLPCTATTYIHTYNIRLLEAVRTQRRTIIEREKYVENENVKMVHNE